MKAFFGFGFGPIQSGLMLCEAWRSGNFDRYAVAEVDAEVVAAVRQSGGRVAVNSATESGVSAVRMEGIRLLNPADPADAAELAAALEESDELATALPSVDFYDRGAASVAALLARLDPQKKRVLYAGENHNEAAEILEKKVAGLRGGPAGRLACLNTVIGKMSGTVRGFDDIKRLGLEPMTPGLPRAVLVEAFNRILVSKNPHAGYARGIAVFEEKDDLLPFEEAKLFGHNAVHYSLACLALRKGLRVMSEVRADGALMEFGRSLFEETGRALVRRHQRLADPLFTEGGFRAYGDDLLVRMTNPFLRDDVERVARDPLRKLSPGDRLVGAMRCCLAEGVEPVGFARATAAALEQLVKKPGELSDALRSAFPASGAALTEAVLERLFASLWKDGVDAATRKTLAGYVARGAEWLAKQA